MDAFQNNILRSKKLLIFISCRKNTTRHFVMQKLKSICIPSIYSWNIDCPTIPFHLIYTYIALCWKLLHNPSGTLTTWIFKNKFSLYSICDSDERIFFLVEFILDKDTEDKRKSTNCTLCTWYMIFFQFNHLFIQYCLTVFFSE